MENFEFLFSLAGTLVSFFITIIILIVKLIKSIRQKSKLKDKNELLSAVGPLMEIAEQFLNYSGEEKKQFVLTKLNQVSIENNIDFNLEETTKKIEELISLSKKVNVKNKGE